METTGQKSTFRKRLAFLSTLESAFGMLAGGMAARDLGTAERLAQRAANDAAQR